MIKEPTLVTAIQTWGTAGKWDRIEEHYYDGSPGILADGVGLMSLDEALHYDPAPSTGRFQLGGIGGYGITIVNEWGPWKHPTTGIDLSVFGPTARQRIGISSAARSLELTAKHLNDALQSIGTSARDAANAFRHAFRSTGIISGDAIASRASSGSGQNTKAGSEKQVGHRYSVADLQAIGKAANKKRKGRLKRLRRLR